MSEEKSQLGNFMYFQILGVGSSSVSAEAHFSGSLGNHQQD